MKTTYKLKLKNNLVVIAIIAPIIIFFTVILMYDEGFSNQLISSLFICFFCPFVAVSLKSLLSNKPGLIIDHEGIFNRSGIPVIGFVPWEDVESIQWKGPWLCVFTSNNEKYITGNIISKLMKRYNTKHLGTPIFINFQNLVLDDIEILMDQLYSAMEEHIEKSRLSMGEGAVGQSFR